jgi:hypothetical protein
MCAPLKRWFLSRVTPVCTLLLNALAPPLSRFYHSFIPFLIPESLQKNAINECIKYFLKITIFFTYLLFIQGHSPPFHIYIITISKNKIIGWAVGLLVAGPGQQPNGSGHGKSPTCVTLQNPDQVPCFLPSSSFFPISGSPLSHIACIILFLPPVPHSLLLLPQFRAPPIRTRQPPPRDPLREHQPNPAPCVPVRALISCSCACLRCDVVARSLLTGIRALAPCSP